ncbi:MAG TPA: hydantoinase B/oxoprolinase family protein, partial [Gammaproteobacteria bacterium]|nr:hydantoinase B/oxoprolinase family protein [Gammaproteobacteria bacterium]
MQTPRSVSRSQLARQKQRNKEIDTITLDLIENALKSTLQEMDAVLLRSAISPAIREQYDESSMIADHKGHMVAGHFGSYIAEMLRDNTFDFSPGDVILQSDPYKSGGAVSHINDWMVLIPIFYDQSLVGYSSMFGHMVDVGGPVAGSASVSANSIFGEGVKIPPIKIYDKGNINQAALDLVLNNTRTPQMNYRDLMAIVAGSRLGEAQVLELCDRFGRQTYTHACGQLLSRTRQTMKQLIINTLPTEPLSFEDFVDDDGCGNGPFKMRLTVWREEDNAYFDWTGTSNQAPGAINFYLHKGMFKMFVGACLIVNFEPQMLLNEGFYDLIHVTLPKGSLVQP